MADNTFYISAGLPPNDNDPGDESNTFHISAGLIPDDSGESPILPIKCNFNIDEISKGHGPITAAQLGGILVGGS